MLETDKTSNFLKAIDKYAKEQRREIQSRAQEFKKKELQKAEAEVLRDSYFLIQREMAQMRKSIESKVSKIEVESKRKLLEKRSNITETVFRQAENKLLDFTKTEDYINVLKKEASSIATVLKGPDAILYVKKEDLKFEKELIEAFGRTCKVKVSEEITIGGILGYSAQDGLIVDETLDSKLENQRDWFSENSLLNIV
ncbi:MAG: V-type proton ATPase subunit E [Eubacteriales bacterium SKADARSKE-1]|nr:V-type proton ATPase subunit E [Eubacteriales bacterium SKADARSKE-1]